MSDGDREQLGSGVEVGHVSGKHCRALQGVQPGRQAGTQKDGPDSQRAPHQAIVL